MNSRKPRVSIGLPVYNGQRFLQQTFDSLLVQSFADFELIISDNASTDATQDICRAYAVHDHRVHYYRNATNIGIGRNFNRVFELSQGDYFKWASADDICKPEHLERCVAVLDRDQQEVVVLAYPRTKFVDERETVLDVQDPGWDLQSDKAYERLLYVIRSGHWVNPHYGLMRAGALSKTRLMPGYPGGDYRLLAELCLKGKFVEIPEYLLFRRIHSTASSQHASNLSWTVQYYTGGETGVCLPFWQLNIDYVFIILKSQLCVRDKLALLTTVLRSMWWGNSRLLKELRMGLMSAICRSRSHHGKHRGTMSRKGNGDEK